VAEEFVMKFLQREIVALLRLVVVAQFQDLQFAKGVIQITRVKRGAHGFLARRFLFVVTVVLEKFRRFINRHVLRVHLDGHTQPAKTEQSASSACAMRYFVARFTSSSLGLELDGAAESFVDHHFFAVMRPAFDEGVATKDFFYFAGRRRSQMKVLHVMSGIDLMNRHNVGGVIIERGEPLLLLLLAANPPPSV